MFQMLSLVSVVMLFCKWMDDSFLVGLFRKCVFENVRVIGFGCTKKEKRFLREDVRGVMVLQK